MPRGLPSGARFERDPRTGLARLLYDFEDSPRGPDPVAAARGFLQQYRSALLGSGRSGDLALLGMERRPGAVHVRFQQRHGDLPVWGGELALHLAEDGRVRMVNGAFFPGVHVDAAPRLSPEAALRVAVDDLGDAVSLAVPPTVEPGIYPRTGICRPAYRVRLATMRPADREYFVDAATGAILEAEDRGRHVEGSGLVVDENPWVTPGPIARPFPYLMGDGYLRGQYADVWVFDRYENGAFRRKRNAFSPEGRFEASTDSPQFDEQMLYYHVTRARDWFNSRFGFTGRDHPLAAHAHWPTLNSNRVPVPYNNAYYSPYQSGLFFGDGTGVQRGGLNPLARDADVIYHEYTHAVVDRITNLGRWRDDWGYALNEAFADYFSCAISGNPAMGEYSVARSSGMRNLLSPNRFPSHANLPSRGLPESHYTGIIWGATCWDLRLRLGAEKADRILFESLHFMPPDGSATFPGALAAVLQADAALHAGANREAIREVMALRGIREPGRGAPPAEAVTFSVGGRLAGAAVAAHDRALLLSEDGGVGSSAGFYTLNDLRFDLGTRVLRPRLLTLAGTGAGKAVAYDPSGFRAAVGDAGGGYRFVELQRGEGSGGAFSVGSAVLGAVSQPVTGRIFFNVDSPGRLEPFSGSRKLASVYTTARAADAVPRVRDVAADMVTGGLVLTIDDSGASDPGHDRIEVRSTTSAGTPLVAEWPAASLGIADVGQLAVDGRQGLAFVVDDAPGAASRALVIVDLKTGARVDQFSLSGAAVTDLAYDPEIGVLVAGHARPGGYSLIDVASRRVTTVSLSADVTATVFEPVTHTAILTTQDGRVILIPWQT
jgi:Zn-dependent metalloprotease